MAVKARFYVNSIQENVTGTATIVLAPSMKGEENKSWSKYTPAGRIESHVTELAGAALAEFRQRFADHDDIEVTFEKDQRITQE